MRAPPFLAAAFLAAIALATTAHAQSDTVINLLGTVEKIDATSISVEPAAGGAAQTFSLTPGVLVVENKPATLADIRPNDFVASAAVRGKDGKLHSTELRIFPEAMRGLGDGQHPMNDARQQTMTNATVTGAAIVSGSNDLTVTYPGGSSELILDPGVPVTRIELADIGLVRPGTKVRLQGTRTADGASVRRIAVQ